MFFRQKMATWGDFRCSNAGGLMVWGALFRWLLGKSFRLVDWGASTFSGDSRFSRGDSLNGFVMFVFGDAFYWWCGIFWKYHQTQMYVAQVLFECWYSVDVFACCENTWDVLQMTEPVGPRVDLRRLATAGEWAGEATTSLPIATTGSMYVEGWVQGPNTNASRAAILQEEMLH